ncbi:MAG: T9SS type A sorting domain-containing protein [Bacteroidia bacterium]
MKQILFIVFLFTSFLPFSTHAQIEKVIVETYYVSDANDSTDVTGVQVLEPGSKTYRIYVDLKPGSKIRKIYGDVNHALKISSTENFYNNYDRPTAYFGYLMNRTSWFPDNPLLALDSWITIGRATKTEAGVLKTDDTDSSLLGGPNWGGSAGISGGLLVNNDTEAGIPITIADGLMTDTTILSQWSDYGFIDFSGDDTTIFGTVNVGSQFISNDAYLQQNAGVAGVDPVSNKVLVAQLTTKGEISFELNLEVEEFDGTNTTVVKYVANGDTLLPDEKISPALKYPPVCGCKNPKYLEYDAAYGCENNDSCKTLIVCGCTDTAACNYSADANFNIPTLCCYPGYCNDRDLAVVCPDLISGRNRKIEFSLFPNPSSYKITLQVPLIDTQVAKYAIYNSFGVKVIEKNMGEVSGNIIEDIDISKLENGLYLLRLYAGDNTAAQKFMKK